METKQESSLSKTPGRVKISALLPIEIRHVLTVLAVFSAVLQIYYMTNADITPSYVNRSVLTVILLAALFSVLLFVFRMLTGYRGALYAVTSSVVLLALMLRNRYLFTADKDDHMALSVGALAAMVYILWLLLKLTSYRRYMGLFLIAIADAIMIYAYFTSRMIGADTITGKLIFVVLLVLSLSYIKWEYPFAFFIGLMAFIFIIPVKEEPIDWTPVINAGIYVVDKTKDITGTISYYFSDLGIGNSYQSGYSSLVQTGDSITLSDHEELELRTADNMTFIYTDENTGTRMKKRRTLYLTGGRIPDTDRLIDIMFSLYAHNVDNTVGSLFTRTNKLDITYAYLKTGDEIAPEGVLSLSDENGKITDGKSRKDHRKGYVLHSQYLDLDLGNPYLASIIASPVATVNRESVSYESLASYAYRTYSIRFKELVSEDRYALWQKNKTDFDKDLDVSGASQRMKDLAFKITEGCESEYDKCKAIEAYLRQYKYRTDIVSKSGGDTGSARGMNKLAEEFLFETGSGYCIHFTGAMVMLLRLNGIPARYVSGYRYAFPMDRQDVYKVYGSNAHAWPEAYISGFGWVPFEPTSAMSTAEERTWHRRLSASEEAKDKYIEYKGTGELYRENAGRSPYPAPAVVSEETDIPEERSDLRGLIEIAVILLIIVCAVILVAVIMLAGSLLYKHIKYKRSDTEGRLMMDVSDITSLLKKLADENFTDRGIVSDYDPFIPDKYRSAVKEVFEVYYRTKYRCRNVNDRVDSITGAEGETARKLRKDMYDEYGSKLQKIMSARSV